MKIFDFEETLRLRKQEKSYRKSLEVIATMTREWEEELEFKASMGIDDSKVANYNDLTPDETIKIPWVREKLDKTFDDIARSMGLW